MKFRFDTAPQPSPQPMRQQGFVRLLTESALVLAVAVTIFRAFFAEGYMISTGSMAPTLLGYHRRVCCAACEFEFARGAAVPSSNGQGEVEASAGGNPWRPVAARCPNCGEAVPLEGEPRVEGDQLLVHKHHYALRDPVRWEVAVFRNPRIPTQAYVKRVVGLPGESIELVDGNVLVDGALQRKPLQVQTSLRIPISDDEFAPGDDADWRPRWQPESRRSDWRRSLRGSTYAIESPGGGSTDWLVYRHWVKGGGNHRCRTPLAAWPLSVPEPGVLRDGFRYVSEEGALEGVGAMPAAVRDEWLARVDDPAVQQAILDLYDRSHQPPLIDECAYNHPDAGDAHFPVHELMLDLELTPTRLEGEFSLALHDGCHELCCTLDLTAGEARLTADGEEVVHRRGSLTGLLQPGEPASVLISLFDRQAVVAINGQELFEPLAYAGEEARPKLPQHPAKFGARGAEVEVRGVRLYRDVYYTPGRSDASRRWTLQENQFFVLGDNSPVSLDSRMWDDPAVPRSMLIGRPFVVHLPSRQQGIYWKGRQEFVRVPDLSRVRYIR